MTVRRTQVQFKETLKRGIKILGALQKIFKSDEIIDAGLDSEGTRTLWISNVTPIEIEIILSGKRVKIEEINFTAATASEETKERVKRLLKTDSLWEAERVTGRSCKNDEATQSLGLSIHLGIVQKKRQLLNFLGDTTFSENVESYQEKIEAMGFEKVYEEEFDSQQDSKDDLRREGYYIYFLKKHSMLLDWDTFRDNRNGAKLHYNILINPRDHKHDIVSSGRFVLFGVTKNGKKVDPPKYLQKEPRYSNFMNRKNGEERYHMAWNKWHEAYEKWHMKNNLMDLWVGDHDGREALLHKVTRLATEAMPLKKWIKNDIFSLTHHMDWQNLKEENSEERLKEMDEITLRRYEKLPQFVKDAIGKPRHF